MGEIRYFYKFYLFILEEAIQPNLITYPSTDWIIGNHADELVPW